MVSFSFSREDICLRYALLLDAQIDEDDPRFDDYLIVMGTEFRVEAYATDDERDSRLGPASEHIEFVPVNPDQVATIEYPLGRMAIGPAMSEPGFDRVAPTVIAATIDLWGACDDRASDLSIIIARTEYILSYRNGLFTAPAVSWRPLFKPYDPAQDHELELGTAHWLRGFVAGRFSAAAA